MNSALRTESLSADRGGVRVLHDVSISFQSRCWTGVVGANGSGKTTLLKVLSGRLSHASGTVFLGESYEEATRLVRATRVGFAPEAALLPSTLTGGELLTMMGEDRPADPDELAMLREALEIDRLEGKRIGSMSAGMRQRIALFAAFVSRTDVVILDEPFNWLDPVCTYDVKEALRQLVDGRGLTLITALHDFGTLTSYCDQGVLLSDGRVVREIGQEELRGGSCNLPKFESRLIADLRSNARAQ
jgi:ABC-type multidrug transport system ATPase subunit